MKYLFLGCALLAYTSLFAQVKSNNSNYKRLWEHIERQEYKQAEKKLSDGSIEPEKIDDAYLTGLYLKTYLQSIDETTNFIDAFYKKTLNPDPYVYALWFSPAVLGPYGKKAKSHQIALIKTILQNPKTSGTLKAATRYQFGVHYMFQNKFDSAKSEYNQIGGLQHWQYVGPFENLSESGLFKNYGPLEKADGKSEFISYTNAKVKWFSPPFENSDGWITFSNQFNYNTAVTYAQTFVTSPINQEILCNVGVAGAIRIWIDDSMILSEATERVTELDTYTVKCKLQKGVNRILVQMSFTNKSYPNFAIRLTDSNFQPISGLSGSNVFKPYTKTTQSPTIIGHFAEGFFQKKIQEEPQNVINYLLLSDVYMRNQKTTEARNLLESALKVSENNLLRVKLTDVLLKEENQTVMLEEVDKIRRSDPKAALIQEIDIRKNINTERYNEALEQLAEYEKTYGEDFLTLQLRIGILSKQKKITELVAIAEAGAIKYPDHPQLLQLLYVIQKEMYRNKEAAMRVYEDYLQDNHNYTAFNQYLQLLHEEGKFNEVVEKRKWLIENFPQETSLIIDLAQYHINAKEYPQAEEYLKKAISFAPYEDKTWELLGDVKREQNKKEDAIQAYQKTLLYDPNEYDVISKLRTLMGKPDTYKIIPQVDIDGVIAKDVPPAEALTSAQGYYVIHEDRSIVMHPGGATEDYNTYILRITNEKGIEAYKESRIDYGSSQNLFIEQFDLIKSSGARIRGERKDNEIVFTNLEVGDVIVFRYRFQNFSSGRFANDFWSKHYFQSESYNAHSRYSMLLPSSRKLNYVVTNSTLKPVIKDVEDFKQYTWEVTNQPGYKAESYMPAVVDVVPVLHVSTLNSWNDIATWYADLINKSSDETFELTTAFQKIFPDQDLKKLTEFERARMIYTYIHDNIRYSSVSFRQGAYRPQTASKTIATRLGDCKDLSNLFMKLCEMAGIQVRMILTDTRDNGEKDAVLPSLEFNHCIAKARLDSKEFYIELTDNHLPFTSLPNNLVGALILEIPGKSEVKPAELKTLQTSTKLTDVSKAELIVRPTGNDLVINATRTKHGHLTSTVRTDFSSLSYEKQLIKLEDYVASQNKNISIDTLFFTNLESPDDSLTFSYRYNIKDEVAEIANMKTFKLIFPDLVATSNHFSSPTREYPVNYVAYEDTDYYETSIRVEIPDGKKFLDLPANISLSFGGMTYDLKYNLVNPELLLVSRKFKSNRTRVDVKEYTNLKTFLDSIVKAEQRMIAFQ
jgi:tetratricopeptide (TPR) repeat protein